MATELVISATSDKLAEMDWSKNIEICEFVARDHRKARDIVKAIKKRLGSKNSNTQLYAVLLLEMLMNNIGEHVHKQVVDNGVLPILVKMVKKKSDLPVRERIFLLLDAAQTSVGGATGKFPQYYSAYSDLVSSGVQFPQTPVDSQLSNISPDLPSQTSKKSASNGHLAASGDEVDAQQAKSQIVPESSIIQKASNALEVLNEVLDAVDPRNPEGAKDEFTLDLVEQCSFQKQGVMHLVMSSRDEKLVSRAIELNEQLQRVLTRHDALLSGSIVQDTMPLNGFMVSNRTNANHARVQDRMTSTANHTNDDDAEEEVEEPEQLFRRLRKGKACARPEDEGNLRENLLLGKFGSSIPGERLNRPLIRPLSSEQSRDSVVHPPVVIPPPPAKHMERERFFQKNKVDGAAVTGHTRSLSLHSHSGSSSRSGSADFSN